MDPPVLGAAMTPVPFTVAPDDALSMARRLMKDHGIRHLPVVSEGALVGVLSERNLQGRFGSDPPQSVATQPRVRDAMTRDPYVVELDTPLKGVVREMARRKLGSAVVVQKGRVVGVFTTTDGMRLLAEILPD